MNPRRVVMIGDAAVGKTSIIGVLSNQATNEPHLPTTGASFIIHRITGDGQEIVIQLWDTAGQERFRSLGPIYYHGAIAAIAVFDLTSHPTFASINWWINAFLTEAGPNCVVFCFGNKQDLDARAVSPDTIAAWLDAHPDVRYFETSALTGFGIQNAFAELGKAIADVELRPGADIAIDRGPERRCC
jgi:Ras-related protein Rab-7A